MNLLTANINRFDKRPGRLIIVNNKRWKWYVGRRCGIIIYSEIGEKFFKEPWEILNITPYAFERGQHKKTSYGMITPGDISKWIETNL